MQKLVILSGKSGCGKTFLINNIVTQNLDKLEVVKKLTTRKLRPCEHQILDLKTDCSIENVMKCDIVTKTAGQYYGIIKESIDNIFKKGKSPVIITSVPDVIKKLKDIYMNNITVYIKIDLTEDELFEKLKEQGREESDINNKLHSEKNFKIYDENKALFDYVLINNYDINFRENFINILKKEQLL